MKKPVVNRALLHILVSVYNQSIQTYYYFPEVILCGRQRLEPKDFFLLLTEGFITVSGFDSFGKYYHLTKKGESFLFESIFRRRHRQFYLPLTQSRLPFVEMTV